MGRNSVKMKETDDPQKEEKPSLLFSLPVSHIHLSSPFLLLAICALQAEKDCWQSSVWSYPTATADVLEKAYLDTDMGTPLGGETRNLSRGHQAAYSAREVILVQKAKAPTASSSHNFCCPKAGNNHFQNHNSRTSPCFL